MHGNYGLDHTRDVLAENAHDRGRSLSHFDPLDIDPYLAMSLLQKAIRHDRSTSPSGAWSGPLAATTWGAGT